MLRVAEAEAPSEEVTPTSSHMVLEAAIAVPKAKPETKTAAKPKSAPEVIKSGDVDKAYAKELVIHTWSSSEWEAFDTIISKESGWTVVGDHPGPSSAFGLGGFLNSTWAGVGCVKTYDPNVQIECTIKYIQQRYGTPTKALQFHRLNNWY